MPVSTKYELSWKLDKSNPIVKFIEWYEDAYRTENENGRKRKGNAKKKLLEFIEAAIKPDWKADDTIGEFVALQKEFAADSMLPKELQEAKNNLSEEEYKQFNELYKKITSNQAAVTD